MKKDFINIGYFVTQPIKKPDDVKIVSKQILTASDCFCDMHPDNDTIFYEEILAQNPHRKPSKYFKKLDVGAYKEHSSVIKSIYLELLDKERICIYPYIFRLFSDAKLMQENYFPELDIFSIALHRDHILLFKQEMEFRDYKPKFEEPKLDGEFIGYDILGYDWGKFHTYLCNGLEETIKTKYDLKTNELGLIENTHEDVKQFAEYLNGLQGEERGEPVLYLPFAVYRHSK